MSIRTMNMTIIYKDSILDKVTKEHTLSLSQLITKPLIYENEESMVLELNLFSGKSVVHHDPLNQSKIDKTEEIAILKKELYDTKKELSCLKEAIFKLGK